jgi:hypothetical protein
VWGKEGYWPRIDNSQSLKQTWAQFVPFTLSRWPVDEGFSWEKDSIASEGMNSQSLRTLS